MLCNFLLECRDGFPRILNFDSDDDEMKIVVDGPDADNIDPRNALQGSRNNLKLCSSHKVLIQIMCHPLMQGEVVDISFKFVNFVQCQVTFLDLNGISQDQINVRIF